MHLVGLGLDALALPCPPSVFGTVALIGCGVVLVGLVGAGRRTDRAVTEARAARVEAERLSHEAAALLAQVVELQDEIDWKLGERQGG